MDTLALDDEAQRAHLREDPADRATTVEAVLGRHVGFDEAAVRCAGFEDTPGIRLEEGHLTNGELAVAAELRAKFAASDWTSKFLRSSLR